MGLMVNKSGHFLFGCKDYGHSSILSHLHELDSSTREFDPIRIREHERSQLSFISMEGSFYRVDAVEKIVFILFWPFGGEGVREIPFNSGCNLYSLSEHYITS